MERILSLLGIFFSWFFTHCYYKKSLEGQAKKNEEIVNELKKLIPLETWKTQEGLKLKYIELGMEEYKRAGTPKAVIDTFSISQEEKAQIYDAVLLRIKGRPGKSNPYR